MLMNNKVIRFLCVQTVAMSMVAGLCGSGMKASAVNDKAPEVSRREIDMDNVTPNEFKEEGVTLYLPPEYTESKGIIDFTATDLTSGDGIYLVEATYRGMTQEDVEALQAKEDRTEEEMDKYYGCQLPIFEIVAIDKNRDASDLIKIVNTMLEGYGADDKSAKESDLDKIVTVDDCTFFRSILAEDENYKNLEPEFKEEYDVLLSYADSIIENADYYKPEGMFKGIIGKKISFETTDIDGNPIKSEDLFAEHDITMINVWATWCGWCISELPELEEINGRITKDNCAIVGFLGDGNDDETIEEGKGRLAEAGCTYTNILPFDGWEEIFDMSQGWPTSFLVDSTGTIIARPIVGARIGMYEDAIYDALEGKTK
jgi:thiol-disulfide isomerase/thioredoxin